MTPLREFWVSSGFHLLDRAPDGGLALSDDYLRAYYARPEVMPPEEACAAERALHARLMHEPRRAVAGAEIQALADPDARENWTLLVRFRDHLLAHPTLEAAYRALALRGAGGLAPLFFDQLVHAIARNAFDAVTDAYLLRAGELLFRAQKLGRHDGALLLADAEVLERLGPAPDAHASPLLAMFEADRASELDVLGEDTEGRYFSRSDGFDLALDFGFGRRGRRAFADMLAHFLRHMADIEVAIEPVERIEDPHWTWFIGLDAEATRIGNAVWHGEALEAGETDRILALFRMQVADPARLVPRVAGRPIDLLLAAGADGIVRMKPQNLIAGLPLRDLS